MKILVILPLTGLTKEGIDERMAFLRSIARPGTEINYEVVEEGPPANECPVDSVQATAGVIKTVMKRANGGYDAMISWCGGGPGVEPARTIVDIPVINPGEAMRILLAANGGKKIASVGPGVPVLEIRKDMKRTMDHLRKTIKEKAEEGYDSFYLSCLGLWGLGKPLREETGLPVIDGAEASLKMAELLVELGFKPSRIAYRKYPPAHRR